MPSETAEIRQDIRNAMKDPKVAAAGRRGIIDKLKHKWKKAQLMKEIRNVDSQQIHYKVKPGQFIFFNSYMPHSYVHHKGKEKFRFIHFNMQVVVDPSKSTSL